MPTLRHLLALIHVVVENCHEPETGRHYHVFDRARGRLTADAHELEAVAMEMERMNVVAGIAEFSSGGGKPCLTV